MNKVIVAMICIIVIIGAIFTAVVLIKPNSDDTPKNVVTKLADEEILDDCTDEYQQIESDKMLQANSEEEKISPNCSLTIHTYYQKCGHTKEEYLELPEELVNKTKEEVQEKYKNYTIKSFASNEIVLSQEQTGECGEHYLVKDKEGTVTIFRKLEDGTQEELEQTGITTEYLTDTDKVNMEKGIEINGRQALNQLIEDFE